MLRRLKALAVISCLLPLVGCNVTRPQQTTKHNPTAAKYNVQLGVVYLRRGDPKRAKAKLLLALRQAPKWPVAYDAMAYYFELTGDAKIAGEYYRYALRLAPHSGRVLNNYGAFLCRQKKYKQAEHYLLQAATDQAYINTAAAYENAGLCALQIPNDVKAAEYFKKAVAQDPHCSVSWLALAKLSRQHKQYKLAQKYLNQYKKLTYTQRG